ncbi:Cyclohexanone monooxygenase [Penicillium soppii]|uniref:Cyclohexanone monooxygenase n=1 Tax=Penicillium soppii TaxID=69789 RepID=UPI002546F84C|nr:Cyclohexanone monooxygenase [Penicillium soppii]KAJ5860830.1 Cyclohexanone monooxygenase [Penicillium soppii]
MVNSCLDIVIIGAGLSGINTAHHIQSEFPGWNFAIIETRGDIGGTWNLFRYPGIRADSDCYTLSFPWYPWTGRPFAEGASVAQYIRDAAVAHGIDQHILFHHQLTAASWSDKSQRWTLKTNGTIKQLQARYVVFGTGYYRYDKALATTIPGIEQFNGNVLHPQFWPRDFDYAGKRIIVIGSGATAITLLPKLAEKASHVTMLQRSPSYILTIPRGDWLNWLPSRLLRIGWIIGLQLFYWFCRSMPRTAQWILCFLMRAQLPANVSSTPHFQPQYPPWDQRPCVSPGGDFFTSLKRGRADVRTATIQAVTDMGILLDTEEFLPADIIVTATGLHMQAWGGVQLFINGKACDISNKFVWNGLMLQDIPNAFCLIGYPTTTWTLGADLNTVLMCRLLKYLARHGKSAAVPHLANAKGMKSQSLINLKSTYVKAAEDRMLKTGHTHPWRPREYYLLDYLYAKYGRLETGLQFMTAETHEKS